MAATCIESRRSMQPVTVGPCTTWRARLEEGFWFSLCLVLFMILGPFAAPIVLGFLFSSKTLRDDAVEPEAIRGQ